MREDIIYAAWACDFDRLEELALLHPRSRFDYRSGGRPKGYDGPAAYWREMEARGGRPLAALVDALEEQPTLFEHSRGEPAMSSSGKVDIYIWTTNGYRVEITSEGDWTIFVPAE
jgi:hypothetical protein